MGNTQFVATPHQPIPPPSRIFSFVVYTYTYSFTVLWRERRDEDGNWERDEGPTIDRRRMEDNSNILRALHASLEGMR